MTLDALLQLDGAPLPLRVDDASKIDRVYVLVAAGLVEAHMRIDANGEPVQAIIEGITPMGKAEIDRIKRGA